MGLNPRLVTLQTTPSAPLQWPLPWSKPPSFTLCLAAVKLLDEAVSPFWEVSAGRILNIWTARSASNNAAFVPMPYSALTSQLWGASRAGSRLLRRCRGTAATQRGNKRPLAKIYMLQRLVKHHLVLNHTRARISIYRTEMVFTAAAEMAATHKKWQNFIIFSSCSYLQPDHHDATTPLYAEKTYELHHSICRLRQTKILSCND